MTRTRRTARRTAAVTVALTALAGLTAIAPTAQASGGSKGVESRGACTGSATWKLKAKPDNGKIELELEVDSNKVGQTWAVRITDNGTQVFAGNRKTTAPSGSFSVNLLVANRAGSDAFKATASNAATGKSCTGRVTL